VDEPDRQPAFDEAPQRIPTASDPRRLYAIIVVLLGVIVVLAIRPWGGEDAGPPGGDALASVPAVVATPADGEASAPTEGAPRTEPPVGAGADLGVTCGSPSGWRAATLQAWAGRSRPIRSWIAIEPVSATDALDPAIPFAPVATGVVTAIGYCAPLGDEARPPASAVAALWAIRDGTAVPLSLLPLEPASPDALGGLWRRPPEVPEPDETTPGAPPDLWPPGRYVVELATPGLAYHRWLGIEIADLATLRASPGASSPTPSGSAPAP
jgi:hypothetical protein